MFDCWSLTAPIRNSVRGRPEFCKITMTLGRRNLHFPTPNPLLPFLPSTAPWYKFLSLPSLTLPLKSKMAAIIFVRKMLSTRSPKLHLLCWLFLLQSPMLKGSFIYSHQYSAPFVIASVTCKQIYRHVTRITLRKICDYRPPA